MIKQGLELKQQQKLSPLQIQTIKLIELPIQELEQRIRTELEENPVLDDSPDPDKPEETRDVSLDEITDEGDIPAYKTRVNNWGKDPRPEYNTFSVRQSFTQSLISSSVRSMRTGTSSATSNRWWTIWLSGPASRPTHRRCWRCSR